MANAPVGTPAAAMSSFAWTFDPSTRAAAAVGPNAGIAASASASTRPATSGASGPTTTRSTACSRAAATSAGTSVTGMGNSVASRSMPGFPGAQRISGACGERPSARTMACSRPPPPTTRTLTAWR